ncbi:hypothetical protein KO317_00530 [Candidatus Micrarchaeota archaeon]|nr:hypothetical protein [Candidatus Micrarchaeota archaeon]
MKKEIILVLMMFLIFFGCTKYENEYISCCNAPLNYSLSNMSNCTLPDGTIVEIECDVIIEDGEVIGGSCYYEEDPLISREPLIINFPICTHAEFNPCINENCVAMVCGKSSYLPTLYPSVCEITDDHSSVISNQLNRNEKQFQQELYKTFCDFKILNDKTANEIKSSNGEQWINSFRFGIGTTFSEFEEARYYFPVYDKLTYLNPSGTKDRFMNYLVPEGATCSYVPETGWQCQKPSGSTLTFSTGSFEESQYECEQACGEAWEYSLFTRCEYTTNAWICTDFEGTSTAFKISYFPDNYTTRRACELFCDYAWGASPTECTTTENHPIFMNNRGSYYLDVEPLRVTQNEVTYVMDTIYGLNRSFYAEMLNSVWNYQKWTGYTDADGIHHSGMIFECTSNTECLSGLCTNDWGYSRYTCIDDVSENRDIMCYCSKLDNGIIVCYTGESTIGTSKITGCKGEGTIKFTNNATEACQRGLLDEEYCTGCYGTLIRGRARFTEEEIITPVFEITNQNYLNPFVYLADENYDYARFDIPEGCSTTGEVQCNDMLGGICQYCSPHTTDWAVCDPITSCINDEDCRVEGCGTYEFHCFDGVDNDFDGKIDFEDWDCWLSNQREMCSDGLDNEKISDGVLGSNGKIDCCDEVCWEGLHEGIHPCYNRFEYFDFSEINCGIEQSAPSYIRFKPDSLSGIEDTYLNGYYGIEDEYIYVNPEYIDNLYFANEDRCDVTFELQTVQCFDEWIDSYRTGNWNIVKNCLGENSGAWHTWYNLPQHNTEEDRTNFKVPFRYKIIDWGNCEENYETSANLNIMPKLREYGWCEPSTMVTMAVQEIRVSDTYTDYCPEECEFYAGSLLSSENDYCKCNGKPIMYETGKTEPSVKYLYDKKIELQKLNVVPILIATDNNLYSEREINKKCAEISGGICFNPEYPNLIGTFCYKEGYNPTNCEEVIGLYKYTSTNESVFSTYLVPYLKTMPTEEDPVEYGGYKILGTGTEIIVIGELEGSDISVHEDFTKRARAIKRECPNCLVAIHIKGEMGATMSEHLINNLDAFFGYDADNLVNPKQDMNKERLNLIDILALDFHPDVYISSRFYSADEQGIQNIVETKTNFTRQLLARYEKPSLILDFKIKTRAGAEETNIKILNTAYRSDIGGIKGASYSGSDGHPSWRTNYTCDESDAVFCASAWYEDEEGNLRSTGCVEVGHEYYAGLSWNTDYSDWMPWEIGWTDGEGTGTGWQCGPAPSIALPTAGEIHFTGCDFNQCVVYRVDRRVELPTKDFINSAKITQICKDDCTALMINGNVVYNEGGICDGGSGCISANLDIKDYLKECGESTCINTFSIFVMDYKSNQVGARYKLEYTTTDYDDDFYGDEWANEEFLNTFYEYLFSNQDDLVNAGIIGIVYSEWRDKGDGTGLILGEDGKTENFCTLQENSKELIGIDSYVGYSKVYAWEGTECECVECTTQDIDLGLCGEGTNAHICSDGKPCSDGTLEDSDNVKCMPMCARVQQTFETYEGTAVDWTQGCILCNETTGTYNCNIYYSDGTIDEAGPNGRIKDLTIWDADIISSLPNGYKCCMIDDLSGNLFTYDKTSYSQLNNELIIYPRDGDPGQDCGKIDKTENINTCPGSPNMPRRRGELVCYVS